MYHASKKQLWAGWVRHRWRPHQDVDFNAQLPLQVYACRAGRVRALQEGQISCCVCVRSRQALLSRRIAAAGIPAAAAALPASCSGWGQTILSPSSEASGWPRCSTGYVLPLIRTCRAELVPGSLLLERLQVRGLLGQRHDLDGNRLAVRNGRLGAGPLRCHVFPGAQVHLHHNWRCVAGQQWVRQLISRGCHQGWPVCLLPPLRTGAAAPGHQAPCSALPDLSLAANI